MNKYEVVITVWKDGLFKIRDRVESDDIVQLNSQIEFIIENIRHKLEEDEAKWQKIMEDDDIPF